MFVREAWPILEPASPYVHGWHLDVMAEHLEAVSKGQIIRLCMNVPPGFTKSLLTSVMFNAWEWGPGGRPELRYLSTSYSERYVKRDTRKARDLIASDWYRSLWPQVELVRTGETSFENSSKGTREGIPFASLTSGRGDRVMIDDPHSTETAESENERARTTRIFRESVPLRVNDAQASAIVIIMQRLHERDVAGVAKELGYECLVLPMEYEADRRCMTKLGRADRRTYEGELLFPERFSRESVERDKVIMGSYAVASQFQQRPVPREGGLFKRYWFGPERFIGVAPQGTRWVRHWDLAATARRSAAATCGVKLGKTPDGRYVVGHVARAQIEGAAVRRLISTVAATDGKDVQISLPQDPGQAGKAQAADFVAMLAGYVVKAAPETGSKETRAEPFAAQCEAGNVDLVRGQWNDAYLDELCLFPGGQFKDQVDASSGAFSVFALEENLSTYDSTLSWVGELEKPKHYVDERGRYAQDAWSNGMVP